MLSDHNIKWLNIISFSRALYFSAAIWLQWELQYITFAEVLAIESLIQISQLVLELPTGAIADMFGRRTSVALGFALTAGSYILTIMARGYGGFMLMAICLALGEALISGAMDALVYDSLKEDSRESQYTSVNSTQSLIFQIGLALATIIGGVTGGIDMRIPLYMGVASFALTAVMTLRLREPHIERAHHTLTNYLRQITHGVREITRTPIIARLSLYYILYGGITWMCTITYNQALLVDLAYTPQAIGWSVGIMRIANGLIVYTLIQRATWLTRTRIYVLLPIVLSIALLPGYWLNTWSVLPVIMLVMIASSARWNLLGQHVNDHFTSRNRATAISALSMGVAITYTLYNSLIGTPLYKIGQTPLIYTSLGVLSLIIILPLGLYLAKKDV